MFLMKGTLTPLLNLINCAHKAMSTATVVMLQVVLPSFVLMNVMVYVVQETELTELAGRSQEKSARMGHARAGVLVRMQTLVMW